MFVFPVFFALVGVAIKVLDRSKYTTQSVVIGILLIHYLILCLKLANFPSLFYFTGSSSPPFDFLREIIFIVLFYLAIGWTVLYFFAPVKSEYVKVDVKLMKRVGICALGIALSFVLVAVSVQIDVNWIEAYGVVPQKTHDEEGYARMINLVWRFENYYRPAIFALVGLIIGVLDRSEYRMKLVIISLLPFAVRFCPPGADPLYFPMYEFLLVIIYYAIALVMSYFVSGIQKMWKQLKFG